MIESEPLLDFPPRSRALALSASRALFLALVAPLAAALARLTLLPKTFGRMRNMRSGEHVSVTATSL
ncbi:MAG TPA: hypothetical protein VKP30_00885, partial [Polyangiaceae bacterium]|nr:hypothetical protein [Polyangiaceae bacterium]